MSRNVSLLGISTYADGPLPAAQTVQCLLELPDHPKPVVANGTIIHCDSLAQPHPDGSYEIGVFFKEFEERGESTLARYLELISNKEETALKAGYHALKQKIAARKRRQKAVLLKKRKRRQARLQRKRRRLARAKLKETGKKGARRGRKRTSRAKKRS